MAVGFSPTVQEPLLPFHKVFINFRGEDVRNGFVSYLDKALKNAGINAYIDNDEPRGANITVLYRRIEESKIALVVFSRKYMESDWCLNELLRIKERVDEEKLVAIPIFFKVNPSELNKLLDEACDQTHSKVEGTHHIVKSWKSALQCITSMMGMTLRENRYNESNEANFVQEVVDNVMQTLSSIPCLEGEEPEMATPFGIEHRLEQVEEKLAFDRINETRIVGVVGMPGIGKTTLATKLYERNHFKFNIRVKFLNIREKLLALGDHGVRKEFLEELLQSTNIEIPLGTTSYDAYLESKLHSCSTKVFLVLDDVGCAKQLDTLLGDQKWIEKGSKIVVTTRNRAFITKLDPNAYVVPRLNLEDGLMYFSFYAFADRICNPEMGNYLKMSREFVDYARGNPVALRILARDLLLKTEAEWKSRLDTLAKLPIKRVQDLWKISYDELSQEEKDAFLDIACFFRSEDEYYVRSLLDSGDHSSSSEITDLAYKFLISISGGRVEMHDLLHTFAMELCSLSSSSEANEEELQVKCRLWNCSSIIAALQEKMKIQYVRGISLDMSEVTKMPLKKLVFTKMCNLRYLKFYSSTCPRECEGDCKLYIPDGLSLPEEVRYLDWLKFPLDELPSDFNPKDLVDLRLPYSKIEQVWKDSKETPKLKWVDLNNSRMLRTFSGFSSAPNLLRLNLEGCTSLSCLSEEMGTMESLVFLNLRGCMSLVYLPEMNLTSLKTLILSGCSELHEFPLISEYLESLYLDGTAIKDLPSEIVKLQRLILLNLRECRKLGSIPECIGKLKALQELILSGCSNLKSFPNVVDNMENLRVLLLDRTSVEEVPKILYGSNNNLLFLRRLSLCRNDVICNLGSDISELYHLKWLDLKYCKKLISISTLPPNLQCLDAHGCISLETVRSPVTFLMPTEGIHTMFIFTNCCKLTEATKNDIASHIRRKCQMISDDHDNGSFVFRALIGTCYPGYEVPPWFCHQAYGSVLEPKLPPHWCNGKFLGIALCAIVSFRGYSDKNNRLKVKCTSEFENLDASCSRFSVPVGGWFEPGNEPRTVESNHVFIGYISWLNIKKRQEEEYKRRCVITKAKLRFQVTDGTGEEIAECEVVKCGFGLVYEPDDEVSNGVSLAARTRMNSEAYISEDSSDYPVTTPTTAHASSSENSFS